MWVGRVFPTVAIVVVATLAGQAQADPLTLDTEQFKAADPASLQDSLDLTPALLPEDGSDFAILNEDRWEPQTIPDMRPIVDPSDRQGDRVDIQEEQVDIDPSDRQEDRVDIQEGQVDTQEDRVDVQEEQVDIQVDAKALPVTPFAGPALKAIGPVRVAKLVGRADQDLKPQELSASGALVASLPLETIEETPVDADALETIEGEILSDPLTLIISLKDQQLDVYRGMERIESTRISSGKRGYETLTGVFGILQKKTEHYSNLYDNAPMPYMQRLTRSGTALHAGVVPNYPASHGCVRMPKDFAPKLYRMTEIGAKVVMMTGGMVAPEVIEHPTLFDTWSGGAVAALPVGTSLSAGLRETARVLAEGETKAAGSDAPYRILVTRREQRDIAIGTQELLASMGYLEPQDKFVGYVGDGTRKAIKAFQKDHGLRQTGAYSEAVAAKIYEAAGQGPLPDAFLYLRKGLSPVRQVPVTLREPKKKLGTHHFVFMHPSDGSGPKWTAVSLEGDDSGSVLDRITIPNDMRAEISRGLTSGASFIVADKAKHSSVVRKGDDFIVRTNDSAPSNTVAENSRPRKKAVTKRRYKKKKVATKPQPRKRLFRRSSQRTVTRARGFGPFSRR